MYTGKDTPPASVAGPLLHPAEQAPVKWPLARRVSSIRPIATTNTFNVGTSWLRNDGFRKAVENLPAPIPQALRRRCDGVPVETRAVVL
jgi:hypothetical protein